MLVCVGGLAAAAVPPQPPVRTWPGWASPGDPPARLPGSTVSATASQLGDFYGVVDWYPAGHPAMPSLVAHGRGTAVYACGYCHLANGAGRPENASLAGLPAAYILDQVRAFAQGTRRSSRPEPGPPQFMAQLSIAAAREPGLENAARYFAALPPVRSVTVIQTARVPRTIMKAYAFHPTGGGTEPIGERIVEVPRNVDDFDLRDPTTRYIAYVPPGSVRDGATLIRTGGGRTLACAGCHGAGLRGTAAIPSIAGRSPSYVARQLFDLSAGARHDPGAAPMQPVVARLTDHDIVAIAAYLATLPP